MFWKVVLEAHNLAVPPQAIWTQPTPLLSDKLSVVKMWFDDCESSHPTCAPVARALPRRLIATGVTGDTVRLVRTGSMTPETRYATLSHCWGDKLPLRTTSNNEALLEKEISSDIIPRTFQDAIQVARGLRIPYLWIDALCIRQDDLTEWSHEAANMKNVYAGSVLTIAASDGTSSDDGCFAPTRPGDSHRDIQFTMNDARPLHVRAHEDKTASLTTGTQLSSRGWVLQEQLLSRRIVYCMLPELHWQCQCCYQTEAGVVFDAQESNPLPLLKERPGSSLHDIWYQWSKLPLESRLSTSTHTIAPALSPLFSNQSIVSDYSDRKFSFAGDRLSALSGIVEHFALVSGDRHILGCWESSLAQGLLWLPDMNSQSPQLIPAPGIPSWSWLTRYQYVSYNPWAVAIEGGVQKYHTKLLDWHVSWSGTPLVSNITSAQLHIEGPIQEIVLSVAPEALDFNPPYLNVGDEVANFAESPIPWRCAGAIDPGHRDKKQSFTCLLVSSKERKNSAVPGTFLHETVLLLKPVCTNDPKTATYRRVGIANFRGLKRQFVDRSTHSIILI